MLRGSEVFTDDLIRLRGSAHGLRLPTRQSALLAGSTRSMILGRGMEYEESRKYAPGDDARTIDWRVTARTGIAHTKVFQEDRQRAVYLVVDMTSSMHFGTRGAFKSVVAAEVASLIAWAAFEQGDLISTIGISDSGVRRNRPASAAGVLLRQFDMLSVMSRETTDAVDDRRDGLGEALSAVVRQVRAGDLTVVISDFSKLSEAVVSAVEFLSRRRLLTLVWIQDRVEREALPPGSFPVTDGTSFSTLHLSSRVRRERLQRALDNRNQRTEDAVRRLGVPVIQLQPGEDVVKSIYKAFHRGSRLNTRRAQRKIPNLRLRSARTASVLRKDFN